MNLLQIAEPGDSRPKEACRKRVVGIDLGTTHSLVAVVENGTPRCLPDRTGNALLPSVVYYPPLGNPWVGSMAWAQATAEPERTFVSVKRWMGRGVEQQVETSVSSKAANTVRFSLPRTGDEPARTLTPVEISAEILRALRDRAEQHLGAPVEGAVITVPAYFDDAQRQATKDAGLLAGLDVLRLVNEPTAAAVAYGLDRRAEGRFAVYDLGGGTFDISLLELRDGVFTVLSTAGDTALGGDDMDRLLVQQLVSQHPKASTLQAYVEKDPNWRMWALQAAKAAKHTLTNEPEAVVRCPAPFAGEVRLQRGVFDQDIQPLLERTGRACRQALRDANLAVNELDGVLLVGGATRVPAVRRYVEALFQKRPLSDVDPDQVVALGAALQADAIANRREDLLLVDVNPLSLGLVLMGDVVERIIPRNSRLPTVARQVFTTYADGQTGFDLHVVQGERETVAGCRSLARFLLTGLPPMPAGMARLEVTFLLDENGLLQVMAKEAVSGQEAKVEIRPSYGLTQAEIESMLADSEQHAEEDMQARLLEERRREANQTLRVLQKALQEDVSLLLPEEEVSIRRACVAVEDALQSNRAEVLLEALRALEHAAGDFAERRMNRNIEKVLAGKTVQTVSHMVEDNHAQGHISKR